MSETITTNTPALPDDAALVRSLSADRCPACGGHKRPGQTLCGRDYYRLPAAARSALYRRVGSGYRKAVAAALVLLGKAEFLTAEGRR